MTDGGLFRFHFMDMYTHVNKPIRRSHFFNFRNYLFNKAASMQGKKLVSNESLVSVVIHAEIGDAF